MTLVVDQCRSPHSIRGRSDSRRRELRSAGRSVYRCTCSAHGNGIVACAAACGVILPHGPGFPQGSSVQSIALGHGIRTAAPFGIETVADKKLPVFVFEGQNQEASVKLSLASFLRISYPQCLAV